MQSNTKQFKQLLELRKLREQKYMTLVFHQVELVKQASLKIKEHNASIARFKQEKPQIQEVAFQEINRNAIQRSKYEKYLLKISALKQQESALNMKLDSLKSDLQSQQKNLEECKNKRSEAIQARIKLEEIVKQLSQKEKEETSLKAEVEADDQSQVIYSRRNYQIN